MFGFIADAIASITTILLPAYISYKALRTSDPTQLTPWLIYFVILSLVLLVESWTYFIVGWFPFYSWLRLIFLSYLALPQTQGAKLLYLRYVEPFIVQHEKDIDIFINDMHRYLESYGLGYLNQIIDFVRDRILRQNAPSSNGTPATSFNYAQNLLSRFTMPNTGPGALNSINDVYGLLSGVAGAALSNTGSTRSVSNPQSDPSNLSTWLLPPTLQLSSTADKSAYLSTQRQKLTTILHALDREQQSLDLAYGSSSSLPPSSSTPHPPSSYISPPISKSISTQSFEQVSHEDAHYPSSHSKEPRPSSERSPSGNWVSSWFSSTPNPPNEDQEFHTKHKEKERERDIDSEERRPARASHRSTSASKGWSAAMEITDAIQGSSSGVDRGR